jgi:hypothetical protein
VRSPDRRGKHKVVHLAKVSPSEVPRSSWKACRRDVGARRHWFKSLRQWQAVPILVDDVDEEDEEEEDDNMLNQHVQVQYLLDMHLVMEIVEYGMVVLQFIRLVYAC